MTMDEKQFNKIIRKNLKPEKIPDFGRLWNEAECEARSRRNRSNTIRVFVPIAISAAALVMFMFFLLPAKVPVTTLSKGEIKLKESKALLTSMEELQKHIQLSLASDMDEPGIVLSSPYDEPKPLEIALGQEKTTFDSYQAPTDFLLTMEISTF